MTRHDHAGVLSLVTGPARHQVNRVLQLIPDRYGYWLERFAAGRFVQPFQEVAPHGRGDSRLLRCYVALLTRICRQVVQLVPNQLEAFTSDRPS